MSTPRIRLLPVTAAALVAVLALKSLDMLTGASGMAGFSAARASTEPDGAEAADPLAEHEPEPGHGEETASAPEDIAPLADPASMSASEIQVLQSLARRRAELDARERALDMQAKLIEAAEQRVDARVTELKTIEARITEMLGSRDEEAEKQIVALVKVYETMKPKDAARIFEELEERVLLDVATRMKPAKLAPILAAMKPELAEALTVKLVRRLDMPEMAALSETAPAPADAAPTTATPPPTETSIGESTSLDGETTDSSATEVALPPAGPVTDISPAPEPVEETAPGTAPVVSEQPTPPEASPESEEAPAIDTSASAEPDAVPESVPVATPEAEGSPDDAITLPVEAEPLTITATSPSGEEPAPGPAPLTTDGATRAPTGLLPPAPETAPPPEAAPTAEPAPAPAG